MSKRAEERALEEYGPQNDALFPGDGNDNKARRIGFIQGYEQAEKDLEETMERDALKCYEQGYKQAEKELALTTSDIVLIHSILTGLLNEPNQLVLSEDFCKEVLRLFNEKRNGR